MRVEGFRFLPLSFLEDVVVVFLCTLSLSEHTDVQACQHNRKRGEKEKQIMKGKERGGGGDNFVSV